MACAVLSAGFCGPQALGATLPSPGFYGTGKTQMKCLREVIAQTLKCGFAHHIQRMTVNGPYMLLLGVTPVEVHRCYLAVHVGVVECVNLLNVPGILQYADYGMMASRPYVATGEYIERMSNHC